MPGFPARPRGDRVPRIAACLAALVGVVNVASTLTPTFTDRAGLLRDVEPGGLVPLAHAAALPAGVALVVLALALARRRRRAWRLTLTLLVALAALNLLKGLDVEEAAAGLALAGLLVWGRDAFYVEGDHFGARTAARRIPVLIGAAYGVALIAVWAGAHAATPALTWAAALLQAGASLILLPGPETFHGHMHWLGLGIAMIGIFTLLAATYLVFRPRRAPSTEGWARALATRLVRSHGDDTLAFFKLRADKHYFFSADRRAFAGYRIDGGVLLVSGDPVGPADALPGLLAELQTFADVRGLKLSVLGASRALVELGERAGLRSFYIGDEAIVDAQAFSLQGRPIRKVRQSVNRMARLGWTIEVLADGDLDGPTISELESVEGAWRSTRQRIQGFAMTLGRLWAADDDVGGIYVIARDPEKHLRAFVRFLQYEDGLSLDVMRRLGAEPNGLNEALVVAALQHAREQGMRAVSLNFAGFAHVMAAEAALSRSQRLLRFVLSRAHGRFQLERLVRFNDKFAPEWRPRYLVYSRRTHLPLAALRVLQAEAYLRPPRSRPLNPRWTAPEAPPLPAGAPGAAVSLASP